MKQVWLLSVRDNDSSPAFLASPSKIVGIYSSESAANLARDECREARHRHALRAIEFRRSMAPHEPWEFTVHPWTLDETDIQHRVTINPDGTLQQAHVHFGNAAIVGGYAATFEGGGRTFDEAMAAAAKNRAKEKYQLVPPTT